MIWLQHWPKQDCNMTKWRKIGLCIKNIVQNEPDCQPTISLIFSQVKVGKTTPTSCDRRTDRAATTARLLPGFLFYWASHHIVTPIFLPFQMPEHGFYVKCPSFCYRNLTNALLPFQEASSKSSRHSPLRLHRCNRLVQLRPRVLHSMEFWIFWRSDHPGLWVV